MTRLGRLLKGIGALVLLAALAVGIPWALWHFIGWPFPHHLPSSGQVGRALNQQGIADQTLIDALAVVVWVTWAVLVVSIIVEVPAALAGRHAPRLPIAGIFQPVTGRLIAVVLVAFLTLAPRPSHAATPGQLGDRLSAAGGRQPVATMVVRDATHGGTVLTDATRALPVTSAQSELASGASSGVAPEQTASTSRTYVVQRGDTLWAIAERQLGDPLLWAQIYQLNEGRPQPGGTTLTDPHWIDPGWTLLLPAGPPAALPVPAPSPPPVTTPTSPTRPPTSPTVAPTTTPVTVPSRPASSPPATTTAPRRTPTSSRTEARGVSAASTPIRLPSGSIVAGSFAAGVLSALAAGRLRRRRHYQPQPPHPGRHVKVKPQPTGLRDLLVAVRAKRHDPDEDFSTEVRSEPTPMTAIPDDDARARPDVIEAAVRGDEVVRLGISDWPGLTVTGPGAASALRAWLAALIARNGPYGVEILLVGPLGDRLFPGLDLPALRRCETTERALSRLESEMIARTRQLDDAGVADVTAHRAIFPEYPLPLVLIVTDMVPESLESRWRVMAASATRLGLAALVLIPVHAFEESLDSSAQIVSGRIVIAEGGSIDRVTPSALAELVEGGVAVGISATEVVELLGPVASVHSDQEFDEPDPVDELSDNGIPGGEPGADAVEELGFGGPSSAERVDVGLVSWPVPEDPVRERARIRVELLGPALVEAWGEKVSSGLRASAYELLAWYALHPDGATAEAAIDALWPDAPAKHGRERFWTALGNLRSRLHGPGEEGVEILAKMGEHYRPDPSVLDLDLWRFEAALIDAARANDRVAIVAALERAAVAYGGDFYPSADAFWVEPAREDLHRRALDVLIRLAEYHSDDGRPDAAIAILERAIELDPICEDAYRRLITLQAQLGRDDAAQRAWRLLLGRLAELDLEPEAITAELIHDLVTPRSTSTGGRNRPQPRPA